MSSNSSGGAGFIKLDYHAAMETANQMKSSAEAFDSNQSALASAIAALESNWSGKISRVMQAELKDMNRNSEKMRDTLQQMANLAIDSANLLKDVDSTLGTGIKNAQ